MLMNTSDLLHRFVFEDSDVRGNSVQLSDTIQNALQHSQYPAELNTLLSELMAAAALLSATVKLDQGLLTFQIQGQGPLSLLVVECNGALSMRATAKWQGDLSQMSLQQMVGQAYFVITLDPRDGNQPYQGIVDLVGQSIAQILENYMQQSAQLETRLWLASEPGHAAGLLLQKLPEKHSEDADTWQRATQLASTITSPELLQWDCKTMLHRLFHEETVRLFDPRPVQFACRCSQQSVSNMLRLLGSEEVDSIVQEQGGVTVHCDFCHAAYYFDAVDARQLFASERMVSGSNSLH